MKLTPQRRKLVEAKLRKLMREVIKEGVGSNNDAVRQLILYAENDQRLYNVLHKTYVPAILKFQKKGTYDRTKALKLLEYYYQNYVRPYYKKEFGDDIKLSPKDRQAFSNDILTSLEDDEYISK